MEKSRYSRIRFLGLNPRISCVTLGYYVTYLCLICSLLQNGNVGIYLIELF